MLINFSLAWLLSLVLLAACSNQDFAGDAGTGRKVGPQGPTGAPNSPLGPGSPNINAPVDPNQTTNGFKTDDGGQVNDLPGMPVERVGIGFEDSRDMDFNDYYLCFEGHFNVDPLSRNIVSNRDQTVNASMGKIASLAHTAWITIRDASGKETFNRSFYAGPGRRDVMPTVDLVFTKGSTLHVKMDSTPHTNSARAKVELNTCKNTGR